MTARNHARFVHVILVGLALVAAVVGASLGDGEDASPPEESQQPAAWWFQP